MTIPKVARQQQITPNINGSFTMSQFSPSRPILNPTEFVHVTTRVSKFGIAQTIKYCFVACSETNTGSQILKIFTEVDKTLLE
jgi:hypothetical protein